MMNKHSILFLLLALGCSQWLRTQEAPSTPSPENVAPAPEQAFVPKKQKKKKEQYIHFNFENEDLVKIINLVAAKLGWNVILPQGSEAIVQKISFKQPKKIPLSKAQEYLNIFLTLAGHALRYQDPFYVIEKIDPTVRSAIPLYVNIPPKELPDQYIRAVYYLANIKVPETIQGSEPLNLILRDMLSPGSTYMFDPKSNGVIITDRGGVIASVMNIILELDTSGSRDIIEVVPLFNSTASTVAQLLQSQIIATAADTRGMIRTDVRTESGLYFATNTKVIADDRTNSLIIMGRETAVERLREFVRDYMDALPDSGNSILHVYDLQYLDAESFAAVLRDIVARSTTPDQAQKSVGGPEQFFEGVRVVAETYKPTEAGKTIAGGTAIEQTGTVYRGGNRLVIAARTKDWLRIKSLIEELDRPQRQVILEVLIVDLTVFDQRTLASQIRNPASLDLPPGVNFQSAQIIGPILDNPATDAPATTLAADLLRILLGTTPPQSLAAQTTSGDQSGGLIFSVNDPSGSGIWAVFKWLQKYTQLSILSHPFLVTLNNVRAEERNDNIRRGAGDQSIGEGAVSTIKQRDYTASLRIAVTPRISSLERINLQIAVDITDFQSADINNFTRVTRRVETNVNMGTGQILVLGGLAITNETDGFSGTPLLAQIPIIGWFFKNRNQEYTKNNLGIFISPTIVEPKLREGASVFTSDKANRAYHNLETGLLFDNMRDPITRWFFGGRDIGVQMLNEYITDIPAMDQDDQDILNLAYNENPELKKVITEQPNPLLVQDAPSEIFKEAVA